MSSDRSFSRASSSSAEKRRNWPLPALSPWRRARTGRALHVELLLLEVRQDLAGARGDLRRQAGELGDVDAVAAVGAAGHDLAQEDDLAADLLRRPSWR